MFKTKGPGCFINLYAVFLNQDPDISLCSLLSIEMRRRTSVSYKGSGGNSKPVFQNILQATWTCFRVFTELKHEEDERNIKVEESMLLMFLPFRALTSISSVYIQQEEMARLLPRVIPIFFGDVWVVVHILRAHSLSQELFAYED